MLEMLPAGMNENHTQARHNRASAPEVPEVASPHSHRWRIGEANGTSHNTGRCECGEEREFQTTHWLDMSGRPADWRSPGAKAKEKLRLTKLMGGPHHD